MSEEDQLDKKIMELRAKLAIATEALKTVANPKMSMYQAQLVVVAREALKKLENYSEQDN